ncbi:Alpha/beta knot methyltransferase [Fennellomyces sp. T-0311]|nr:Alpha/beta knot methyltransferase [Fennellomyces sp. T-0311]
MHRSIHPHLIHRAFTTSQSRNEHVYGLSSVSAALSAGKRKYLDKLYIQQSIDRSRVSHILDACQQQKIPVSRVDKGELNNMTGNKPHQGVVLDGSPRMPIPLTALSEVVQGEYNGISPKPVSFKAKASRPPLWIVLDEVQDPQNLGSILRTAYYFGVDGVLLCSKNSASLTPAVSKVSAGAMELMDVYATRNLVKFLQTSSEEGWHIVGAAVSDASEHSVHKKVDKPTMLVLGNEGVGLRFNVKRCCNQFVSIPAAENNDSLVDSLNVGVAAGILISQFCL